MRANPAPLDATKREHVGSFRAFRFCDPAGPYVIVELTDGRVMAGPEHPDLFVRGQPYRFLGRWEDSAKYGPQFRFSTVVRDTPAGRPGLIKYLTDYAPNVGRATAEKLWDKYGPDAIRVLRDEPGRVQEDRVMSLDAAKEAGAALAAGAALERTKVDLFGLFAGRGLHGKLIDAAIELWGAKAPDVIRRDPFKMLVADLPSAGFRRCDKLYGDLGYPSDRLKRQLIYLWNWCRESSDGHTWHDGPAAVKALREGVTGKGVNPKRAILLGKRAGWLRLRKDDAGKLWIAETRKAINEAAIARHVRRLMAWDGPSLWPDDIPVSQRDGDGLPSEHQRDRAAQATAGPVGCLIGGPGTGKTHTLAFVLRAMLSELGTNDVRVVAPTGKAAVRATQSLHLQGLGSLRATTIHRALEIGRNGHDGKGWGFVHNEGNPLPIRVLVVDETSMIDTDLMAALLAACPDGTHVLFIGDPFQLAPVGHGAPLRDLIAAGVPTGELTQVRRNAGAIVHACTRVKAGEQFETSPNFDPEKGHNLIHLAAETEAEAARVLEALLRSMRKFDPVWQTQVIVGVNGKSVLSRVAINTRLHGMLNPDGFAIAGNPFRVGDKVICLKNSRLTRVSPPGQAVGSESVDDLLSDDRSEAPPPVPDVLLPADATQYRPVTDPDGQPEEIYVANGEIGRVVAVAPGVIICRMSEADELVKVPMGKKAAAGGPEADEDEEDGKESKAKLIDLAYAVSGHKMQGSEAPCVIILADPAAGRVAERHWWYTSLSRASKLCVIIGDREVVDRQRLRVSLVKRKTFLVEELAAGEPAGVQA